MKALIVANAVVDETYAVETLPGVGESLIGEFRTRDVGGKGTNVGVIMARCGIDTRLVAVVGDDERAAFVRARLDVEPLRTEFVVSPNFATDLSLVYATADGDNAIVTTVAATRSLTLGQALAGLDACEAGDTLVLQGNLLAALNLGLIEAARERRLHIAFNPSPLMDWSAEALARVDTVFVNAGEARALTGGEGESAVRALLERGPSQAVLTLGPEGALCGRRTGQGTSREEVEIERMAAAFVDVLDTTGAGDTFMAVALASAARRKRGIDTLALAHAARASAITVGRYGTLAAFPSAAELDALLLDTDLPG